MTNIGETDLRAYQQTDISAEDGRRYIIKCLKNSSSGAVFSFQVTPNCNQMDLAKLKAVCPGFKFKLRDTNPLMLDVSCK